MSTISLTTAAPASGLLAQVFAKNMCCGLREQQELIRFFNKIERLDRAKIVNHGRVDADHGVTRHAAERCEVFACERPISVVLVPVPGIGEDETLSGLESERMDVVDEDQQAGKLLPALDETEL